MISRPSVALTHFSRPTAEESHQHPLEFGLIRRLFLFTKPYAGKRNCLFALVLVRSIQIPVLAWMIGAVIKGPISHGDLRGTWKGALGFLAWAAFTQVAFHFRQRLALELGESVMQDLRAQIFRHLMRMPMGFYHRTRLGRILSRITSDADAVRVGVQDVLFVSMVQAGQMLFSAALMLYYDRLLFIVMVLMAPMLWGLNRHFHRKLSDAGRAVQESWSRVTSTLAESVNGIRVTQGFARQDINATFFRELVTDHSKYNLGVARAAGIFLPLLEMHGQLFNAVLLVAASWQVMSGRMPFGDILPLFFLANLFLSPIPALGQQYNQALTAMAGAERVFRLLDSPPDWEDAPSARPLRRDECRGRVEFCDVSFGYSPDRLALQNVSFVAEPGQTVAFVGHTGSGKSSLANLIAKFYLATHGRVWVDGRDIRDITSDSLHQHMGLVPQQNFLFSGTVRDNIRLGRPSATEAEIREVVRQLDLEDLLADLPGGLSAEVGERGAGLSLGQRQLICFARAMIADPRILVLDEATSSVDTLTEQRLQRALVRLLKGRTSFVVAHRLSTIRHADLVLVLDHGRIAEQGRHTDLIAAGGLYTSLHREFAGTNES